MRDEKTDRWIIEKLKIYRETKINLEIMMKAVFAINREYFNYGSRGRYLITMASDHWIITYGGPMGLINRVFYYNNSEETALYACLKYTSEYDK